MSQVLLRDLPKNFLRQPFLQKWQDGPKQFVPGYQLPSIFEEELEEVRRIRNSFAHSQIEVSDEAGNVVHESTSWIDADFDTNPAAWFRFVSLPYRLVEFLADQVEADHLSFFIREILIHGDDLEEIMRRQQSGG